MPNSKSRFKLNNGTESVSISLPGSLIEIVDGISDRKDFTKSTFTKRALKKAILLSYIDDPDIWELIYKKETEAS